MPLLTDEESYRISFDRNKIQLHNGEGRTFYRHSPSAAVVLWTTGELNRFYKRIIKNFKFYKRETNEWQLFLKLPFIIMSVVVVGVHNFKIRFQLTDWTLDLLDND